MNCLFCDTGNSFNTKEHILPESLGNNDLILEKEVCDNCQNFLSKIENYVLSRTPIGFWRTLLTIKTKKGKLPSTDFIKSRKNKGVFPDFHEHHDNIKYESHPDFTTEVVLSDPLDNFLKADGTGEFKYVITPKALFEIGRFLGKVGIEMICQSDKHRAREDEFNPIRKYIREGSLNELWPIFHTQKGNIKDLFEYIKNDTQIEKRVECYSYHLLKIGSYMVFNLKIGTDSWFICLNQQFPHPEIRNYMGNNVNIIWYSNNQCTKNRS